MKIFRVIQAARRLEPTNPESIRSAYDVLKNNNISVLSLTHFLFQKIINDKFREKIKELDQRPGRRV